MQFLKELSNSSAFTVPTGKAHWHTLLRARAIETQCFVVAAAQCGKHNEKRSSFGHSLVVDPWGEVILATVSFINKIQAIMIVKINPVNLKATELKT